MVSRHGCFGSSEFPRSSRRCSGQIGFMVCTKAAGDGSAPPNAAEPRQPLPGTPEGRGYTPLR